MQMIPVQDRADFCMISIVDGLLIALHSRTMAKTGRDNRYQAIRQKLDEIERSYVGRLPESFEGFSVKCMKAISEAINQMIVDSNEAEMLQFAPNGAPTAGGTHEKATTEKEI